MRKKSQTKQAFTLSILAFSVMNAHALPTSGSATGGTNTVTVSGTGTSRTITVGTPNANYSNVHVANFDNFNVNSGETITITGTSANTSNKRLVFIDNQGAATSINGTVTNNSFADLMLINKYGINVGATGIFNSAYNNKTMLIAGDVTNIANINPAGGGDADVRITFNPSTDAGVTVAAGALFKYDTTSNSVSYTSNADWNGSNTLLTTDGTVQGAFQTGGNMTYADSAVFTNIKAKRQYVTTGKPIQPVNISAQNDLSFTNYTFDNWGVTDVTTYATTVGDIYFNNVTLSGSGSRTITAGDDVIGTSATSLGKVDLSADEVSGLTYFIGNLTANTLRDTSINVGLNTSINVGTLSNSTLASSSNYITGTIGNSDHSSFSGGVYTIAGNSVSDTYKNTYGGNTVTVNGDSTNSTQSSGTTTVWGTTTGLIHTAGTFNGKGAVNGGTMSGGTEVHAGPVSNRSFNAGTSLTLNGASDHNTFKFATTLNNTSSYDVFNGSGKIFTVNGNVDNATLSAGTLNVNGNASYNSFNGGVLNLTGSSDHNTYKVSTTVNGVSNDDTVTGASNSVTFTGEVNRLTVNRSLGNTGRVTAKAGMKDSVINYGNVTIEGDSQGNFFHGAASSITGNSSHDTYYDFTDYTESRVRYGNLVHTVNGTADHMETRGSTVSAGAIVDSLIYDYGAVNVQGNAERNTVNDGGELTVSGSATYNTINDGGMLKLTGANANGAYNTITNGHFYGDDSAQISGHDTFVNADYVDFKGTLNDASIHYDAGVASNTYGSSIAIATVNRATITGTGYGSVSTGNIQDSDVSGVGYYGFGTASNSVFHDLYNVWLGIDASTNTGNVYRNVKGVMGGHSIGNLFTGESELTSRGDSADDTMVHAGIRFAGDITRATVNQASIYSDGTVSNSVVDAGAISSAVSHDNTLSNNSVLVSGTSTRDSNINGAYTIISTLADGLTVDGGEFIANSATIQNSTIQNAYSLIDPLSNMKNFDNTVRTSSNNVYVNVTGFEVWSSTGDTITNSGMRVIHDMQNANVTDTALSVYWDYATLTDSVITGGSVTGEHKVIQVYDGWTNSWTDSDDIRDAVLQRLTLNHTAVTSKNLSDSVMNGGSANLVNSSNNRFDGVNVTLTSTVNDTFLNGRLLSNGSQNGLHTQGTDVTIMGDLTNSVLSDGTSVVFGNVSDSSMKTAVIHGNSVHNVVTQGATVDGTSTNDTFGSGTYHVHGAVRGLQASNNIITFDDDVSDSVLNQVNATFVSDTFVNNTVSNGVLTFQNGAAWLNSTASGDDFRLGVTGDFSMDGASRISMTTWGDMQASTITTDVNSHVFAQNLALDITRDSMGNIGDSNGTPGKSAVSALGVSISGNVRLSNGSAICWNGTCTASATIIGPSSIVTPPPVVEPEQPPVIVPPEEPPVIVPPVEPEQPPVVVPPVEPEPEQPPVIEPPVVVDPIPTPEEPPVVVPPVVEPEPEQPPVIVPPVIVIPPVIVPPTTPSKRDVAVEMAQETSLPVTQVVVTTRVSETTAMSNGIYVAQPTQGVETPSVVETFNPDEQ